MGWWNQDRNGHSFSGAGDLVWGDKPADIIDRALDEIVAVFRDEWGRAPTKCELLAGVKFSIGAVLDDERGDLMPTRRECEECLRGMSPRELSEFTYADDKWVPLKWRPLARALRHYDELREREAWFSDRDDDSMRSTCKVYAFRTVWQTVPGTVRLSQFAARHPVGCQAGRRLGRLSSGPIVRGVAESSHRWRVGRGDERTP
jgi:hypothetical protein